MAEIPVEKKSGGIPWWVWLLLALLLIGLLIWLLSAGDDDDEVAVIDDNAVEQVDDTTGIAAAAGTGADADTLGDGDVITDLAMIANTSDGSLEGRPVRLTGVEAGSVPEDAGFYASQRRAVSVCGSCWRKCARPIRRSKAASMSIAATVSTSSAKS